jgi:hypothetical protein
MKKKMHVKAPVKMGKSTDISHAAKDSHGSDANTSKKIAVTDADVSSLLFMIEEEKMARDVYNELFEQTGLTQFDKISDSEQTHYETLLNTAEKLGIDTALLSTEEGVFTNTDIQDLYDQLVLSGSASTEAAVEVGILIEQTDIADLQAAIETVEISFLGGVYGNLLDASYNHLSAFESIA